MRENVKILQSYRVIKSLLNRLVRFSLRIENGLSADFSDDFKCIQKLVSGFMIRYS